MTRLEEGQLTSSRDPMSFESPLRFQISCQPILEPTRIGRCRFCDFFESCQVIHHFVFKHLNPRHFRHVLLSVFPIRFQGFLGSLGSRKNHSYYQDKQLHHEELPESRHSPWSASRENPSLAVGRFEASKNV